MNNINSSSLFHFTRKFDTLQRIIRTGLRYSFAYEQYPKELIQANLYPDKDINDSKITSNGVAIPMISFCDIPITRAKQHIEKYGKYMIGFDKTAFSKDFENLINPVIYVHSPNLSDAITKFRKEQERFLDKISIVLNDTDFLQELIEKKNRGMCIEDSIKSKTFPMIETRFLSNFLLGLVKPIKDETSYYYDEREWRLFLPDEARDVKWRYDITKEYYKQNRNKWNEDLENRKLFITIPWDCYDKYITHIVVSKERQVDRLIEFIMRSDTLFGYKNDDVASRLKLISKITSFERIEKDF